MMYVKQSQYFDWRLIYVCCDLQMRLGMGLHVFKVGLLKKRVDIWFVFTHELV